MDGSQDYILNFMNSSRKIEIPYYQRNYDWKLSNCRRLVEDLFNVIEREYRSHFFGSIVVKTGRKQFTSIIIDGQQRLTTISLFALAIYNYVKNNNVDTESNIDSWYDNYLVDNSKRHKEIKLNSNPRDYHAYKQLFLGEENFIKNSNITKNYQYFYDVLNVTNYDIDDIIESLEKLEIIVISLDSPYDDAQLIFESLNSTGLDLRESDKIRNFLLMNEDLEKQNYLFENFWTKIEEYTAFDLDNFTRYYLTLKNGKFPNKNRIYEDFKVYYNDNFIDKKLIFFNEFLDYSKAYSKITNWDTSSQKVNIRLKRFNKLDVNIIKPFLLGIVYDYSRQELTEEELIKILDIIEIYIARRSITKESSNALNKVFAVLYRDLQKHVNDNESNFELDDILSYLLLNKKGSAIFPDDEMLVSAFKINNFYNINRNFRTYLFERLENADTLEAIDIYSGVENGIFTVEHIMPRKLSTKWKEELGQNYLNIHDKYLNSIGNLTLTGYNSKYSNRSFQEKRDIKDGFIDSKFKFLNNIPSKSYKWSLDEIKTRINSIIERALEVWKLPKTIYEPKKIENEMIPFEGFPDQFTNYSLKGYTFIDDVYREQRTWVDLFFDIVKELYEKNPTPILEIVKMKSKGALAYVLTDKSDGKRTRKIDDNVYLYVDMSNWNKFNVLSQLFDKYNIEYYSLMLDAKSKE